METQNKQDNNDNALAGNRTRVSRVGGENSTTETPVPRGENVCNDSLVEVLFRSFSTAGHSCLYFQDVPGFHPLPYTLPAALCLLRVALADNQVCFGSV